MSYPGLLGLIAQGWNQPTSTPPTSPPPDAGPDSPAPQLLGHVPAGTGLPYGLIEPVSMPAVPGADVTTDVAKDFSQAPTRASLPSSSSPQNDQSGISLTPWQHFQSPLNPFPNQPMPVSTQPFAWSDDHGQTVSILSPDGTLETRTGGTAAWRNNNPGNLTAAPHKIGRNGNFAIFPDGDVGAAAQQNQLFNPNMKINYSAMPLEQALRIYNTTNQDAYVAGVLGRSGLDRNMVLNTMTDQQRTDLMNAIRTQEGNKTGTSSFGIYNPFGN